MQIEIVCKRLFEGFKKPFKALGEAKLYLVVKVGKNISIARYYTPLSILDQLI
ncbi:hypothetical protein [Thermodesulfobium narugense]|uniref:hypothetical protein n=1 Tax=Thermodesulfobium narugense TaxID=184064 RepID=UPI00031F5593|nr:hypothetical protein [Thermodesulfobium narugense]